MIVNDLITLVQNRHMRDFLVHFFDGKEMDKRNRSKPPARRSGRQHTAGHKARYVVSAISTLERLGFRTVGGTSRNRPPDLQGIDWRAGKAGIDEIHPHHPAVSKGSIRSQEDRCNLWGFDPLLHENRTLNDRQEPIRRLGKQILDSSVVDC